MFSAFLFILNVVVWSVLLYPLVFIKILIPIDSFRRWITQVMIRGGEIWIAGNDLNLALTQEIRWKVEIEADLNPKGSYLVIANHRSWIDIIILQHVFNRRLPFLRFFLKSELIYVPLLGGVWWGLDYPFMKRYSREYLEKHPEKRGEDLATTQQSLEKFKGYPVSILNFLEGTRWTPEKRAKQNSPYKHLLKPKAGGLAATLETLGRSMRVIDVTITYPYGTVSYVEMCFGKLKEVVVHVRELPTPEWLGQGTYADNLETREKVQSWVQKIWEEKDRRIEETLKPKL